MLKTNCYFSCLFIISLCFSTASHAQELLGHGGGPVEIDRGICVTPEQRQDIEMRLRQNVEALTQQGLLAPVEEQSRLVTKFGWPLRQAAGFDQPNYYITVNFTDLDPTSGIQDYNCGSRSYDGHSGVDISPWPFWWQMMNDDQVEVIAGAPGTIVQKDDGQFDQNCSCTGTWNAVYVQHADGSIAWYGHLKENSLTTKAVGAAVAEGDYIGLVGSSGCSSNPHLHFEIRNNGNFVEGYEGNCNSTTTESWYQDQKPYREPKLNRLMTHSQNPEWNGFCPNEEITDFLTQVNPGSEVRFAAYYSDQTANTQTIYSIKDSNGNLMSTWSHGSTEDYTSPFWYWIYEIPGTAVQGYWTFEASFLDQEVVHEFLVGMDVSTDDQFDQSAMEVFPNPSRDEFFIKVENFDNKHYVLKSVDGKRIKEGKLEKDLTTIHISNQAAGIFILELIDDNGRTIANEKLVKMN